MITEPMTMLTDYVLGGVSGWLAYQLFRVRDRQKARTCWAFAFAALALAAVLGGTYHGFASVLIEPVLLVLWKATVFIIGIASLGMFAGSAFAMTSRWTRRTLLTLAAIKFLLYSGWILFHSTFIYVIIDTGTALVGVAALHTWSAIRNGDRGSFLMLGAVGVSLVAALVQAARFAPHPNFNHNDLYHVIQVAAIILFYRGVGQLKDRA